MLSKFVVVDYFEGAGGEYLAYFISSHNEFLSYDLTNYDMQAIDGTFLKYLNSQSIFNKTWDGHFDENFRNFINMCNSSIAIPYHLYRWPTHIDIIKNQQPNTRFVKINYSEDRRNDIFLNFARKILFKKFSKFDISEIKFLITHFSSLDKKTVLQKLKTNDLYFLDFILLRNKIPITSENRKSIVFDLQNKKNICPSTDIAIEYDDFFVNFERTHEAYSKLCDQLEISPDIKKLATLVERNTKNQIELAKFKTTFKNVIEKL